MSLCDYTTEKSAVPQECLPLRQYLVGLIETLEPVNPIRCGSGAGNPTSVDLGALWSPCDVPPGAMAHWYNTVTGIGSQWYSKLGWVYVGP